MLILNAVHALKSTHIEQNGLVIIIKHKLILILIINKRSYLFVVILILNTGNVFRFLLIGKRILLFIMNICRRLNYR